MMIKPSPLAPEKVLILSIIDNPIYNSLNYQNMSPSYCSFISFVPITIPKNVNKTHDDHGWQQAMITEM